MKQDIRHTERLSRQEAADRLADVAYALVVGAPGRLEINGSQVRVPEAEQLTLRWATGERDGRRRLELDISWPAEERSAQT